MTDLPVWLLDVDGVINATRPGWGAAPRKAHAYSGGVEWTIRWAPALLDRIRQVHRDGLAEIRWCTTWCCDADQLERLFGLPTLGREWTGELHGAAAAEAKRAAAVNVVEAGRRLVWTDDTEVPSSGDLYDKLTADGRGLLIAPKPSRGLRPADMDAIELFLKEG